MGQVVQKIKQLLKQYSFEVALILIVILTASASFGLGKLSVLTEHEEVMIKDTSHNLPEEGRKVVASIKGERYHLLSCPGARTIAPENRITFPSREVAEMSGYSPALNCDGL